MEKIFSKLSIKSFDEQKWSFVGVASTITPDRDKDIVRPEGIKYDLPVPLLWQHNHNEPIGKVAKVDVKAGRVIIEAEIVKPNEDMPSGLRSRLQEAWASIKLGLVKGLSIGFRPLKYSFIKDTGGLDMQEWEFLELSVVTVPANVEATILSIKKFSSVDDKGLESVKIINFKNKGGLGMDFDEIVKRLKGTLETKKQERDSLQKAVSEEGRTKNAQEREAFDTLRDEIQAIELEIKDVEALREQDIKTAKPVIREKALQQDVSSLYSGIAIHEAPEKLEKGIAFARFATALGAANGNLQVAQEIAKNRFDKDKRLHHVLKSAVAVGSTLDSNWATALTEYREISQDFVDFLRPRTIIGQFGVGGVPALRAMPFNIHIKGQETGSVAGWVGEGGYKPVTSGKYNDTFLGWCKVAAISTATEELLRFSNPSAAALIRDDLANAIVARMDEDFVDVTNAGVSNVKPASITYLLAGYTEGTASVDADIAGLWANVDEKDVDVSSAVYITTPAIARLLTGLTTAADNKRFPNMTPRGGSIDGVPVIVSGYVDKDAFLLVFASEIWLADDGIVTLDASREASIILSDNPSVDSAGDTPLTAVSMFQTNSVAFRAERYINWKKRRDFAVSSITAENW